MKITKQEFAKLFDLSAVQAQDTYDDIRDLVECAKKYRTCEVIVLPSQVEYARDLLGKDSGVMLGGTAGFPSGGQTSTVKALETREQIHLGCAEIDMLLNVSKLISGRYSEVLEDIRAVVEAAEGRPVKVILECHYLSETQLRQGCDAAIAAGAKWVKTGTGWAKTGATLENVALIHAHVGDAIGIKAAGGVRDLETVMAMYRLGVRRFGVGLKSGVKILEQAKTIPGHDLEI